MTLLERATTLGVLSEYLKAKQLPHSAGSWEEMREKRVLPAISKQKLTFKDLFALLAEGEEFGRNHTFLYQAKQGEIKKLFDMARIRSIAKRLGHERALENPVLVDLPPQPTIVEIRGEHSSDRECRVIKVVERREERRFDSEKIQGNRVLREWVIDEVRAVNLARLHASGLLEIRIQSRANSTLYKTELNQMLTMLKDYVPPASFREISLTKAKHALWQNRVEKNRRVRFSDSIMRNDSGTTLLASTGGEQADLFRDSGASSSIDTFLRHGAYCDSSNIWWLPRKGVTEREIHMRLSGENNEFAITAACTRKEYDYVLNELRVFNR